LFVVLLQTIKILYLSKLYAYLIVTQRVMWAILPSLMSVHC